MDKPVSWDSTGQIVFAGGEGFGLTPSLKSIFLGEEDVITEYLALNGPLPGNIGIEGTECLEWIKSLLGVKQNDRAADNKPIPGKSFRKQTNQRGRIAKNSQHRTCNFVRVKAGKKLPIYKVEPRQQNLPLG